MKAIVSKWKSANTYHEVGTNDRLVISGLKSLRGIHNRASRWARGPHRIEVFADDKFYGEPIHVFYRTF